MVSNIMSTICGFNTQPPEGGWAFDAEGFADADDVSTHSRLKAAGAQTSTDGSGKIRFQHTAA